ncbi:hypothetical protein BDA96_05G223700 [Sorghum bicolor]|uniref:Uncharacterized protein n=1 Tax=Sorghum bicolor TaxID=4558 RepID=A0A921R221_SORBI|nr:hypothetical protein BDA96_05G223700 [Sorghum bicolor]
MHRVMCNFFYLSTVSNNKREFNLFMPCLHVEPFIFYVGALPSLSIPVAQAVTISCLSSYYSPSTASKLPHWCGKLSFCFLLFISESSEPQVAGCMKNLHSRKQGKRMK